MPRWPGCGPWPTSRPRCCGWPSRSHGPRNRGRSWPPSRRRRPDCWAVTRPRWSGSTATGNSSSSRHTTARRRSGVASRSSPTRCPTGSSAAGAVVRVDDYTAERDAELARSFGLAAAVAAPVSGGRRGLGDVDRDLGRRAAAAAPPNARLERSRGSPPRRSATARPGPSSRRWPTSRRRCAGWPSSLPAAPPRRRSSSPSRARRRPCSATSPVALMVYDDSGADVVATCNCPAPVGLHVPFSAGTAIDELFRTGRPAHVDTYEARRWRMSPGRWASPRPPPSRSRSRVGCGPRSSSSTAGPPLPAAVEARLAQFADLAAVAIANAETQREAHRLPGARRRHRRRDPSAPAARRPRRRAAAAGARRHRAQDGPRRGRGRIRGGRARRGGADPGRAGEQRAPRHRPRHPARVARPTAACVSDWSRWSRDLALPVDVHVTRRGSPPPTETTAYFIVAEA